MGFDQQDPSRTSKEDLAKREEASLCFPGSRLVQEEGYDEGEGWGFDRIQKGAMLQRRWSVDADSEEVRNWFRERLEERGWKLGTSDAWGDAHPIGADFYDRRAEGLVVRVMGRAQNRPWWMFWPPGEQTDPRLHYDVTLSRRGPSPPR